MNTLTAIPQNYKNQVEWVFGAYQDAGVTLPNGFQKDDIQNRQGARKNHKWDNWKSDISIVKNEKGTFLVCEDFGTVGLTGDNLSTNKINEIVAKGENLTPDQRLARFTSMNNSGGNVTGGGLYGVGKIVYSVASNDYLYYFDSFREDGKYVANVNNTGQVYESAFEGEEAKEFICEKTGLREKTSVGTRIIISNPKQELLDAIESGEMQEYVQESWWLIINRLGENSSISINGTPVKIPDNIKQTNRKYELSSPETYKEGYRVKNFGVYLFEDDENKWNGFSYYRKGMKIGEIEIKDIPNKVQGKFWGYIEVDEQWEEALAEIEDKVHFGVSKGKKLSGAYQNLKNYCSEKFKQLLIEWGYIKDQENENRKLKEELNKISDDIQDLFEDLGFEDLGKGPQKPDFDVRWCDILYPVKGTMRVTADDEISFSFRIKSAYLTNKKFEYTLRVVDTLTKESIYQIDSGTLSVASSSVQEKTYTFRISKENSVRYAENRIVLRIKVVGSGKEKIKELPYFFDVDKPDNSRDNITLALHNCEFPIEGSRRINFGEELKSIVYRIDNKRNHELNYRLNISIHNATDPSCPLIAQVASLDGIVKSFEEDIVSSIPNILFDEKIYRQHLQYGVLQLRARIIALADSGDYRRGDKITSYHYDLFLNCDEKNGKRDAFDTKSIDKPDDFRRSWFEKAGNDRLIWLNIGHAAYTRIVDIPEVQYEYLYEQVLKQYVLLYLSEGKYDMFIENGESFQDLDPVTAAEKVISKIETIFYRSLG